jgi:paraquat-inducible protein A
VDPHLYQDPLADLAIVACPHCDLLQRVPDLEPKASARCARCNLELRRQRVDPLQRSLALTIAAAVLFAIANSVPMLGLSAVGHHASTTVFGGVVQLWNDDEKIVSMLVLFTAIVAPAAQIGLMLAVLLGSLRARPPQWVGKLLRHLPTTYIWSTIEVMILGVLVALIKIADYATVIPGLALFVLGALVFLLAAMQASFDPDEIWKRVPWIGPAPERAGPAGRAQPRPSTEPRP